VRSPYSDIKEADLAYVAGFLDGEGTISILRVKKNDRTNIHYRPIVCINNTDREILEWIRSLFQEGKVWKSTLRANGRKQVYRWTVGNTVAYNVVCALFPYIRVKRIQAEILIKYQDTVFSKFNIYGKSGTPDNVLEEREACVGKIRLVNKRGF
jgi:hypothetical protein